MVHFLHLNTVLMILTFSGDSRQKGPLKAFKEIGRETKMKDL